MIQEGSPVAVVKAACLESRRSRARHTLWHSGNKKNSSPAHSWRFIYVKLKSLDLHCCQRVSWYNIALFSPSSHSKRFPVTSLRLTEYCGKPPWPRGSVLGHKSPGYEFRILCLGGGGAVSSYSSPLPQEVFWPSLAYICAQRWPQPHSFISFWYDLSQF